jgi:hypothetical protein
MYKILRQPMGKTMNTSIFAFQYYLRKLGYHMNVIKDIPNGIKVFTVTTTKRVGLWERLFSKTTPVSVVELVCTVYANCKESEDVRGAFLFICVMNDDYVENAYEIEEVLRSHFGTYSVLHRAECSRKNSCWRDSFSRCLMAHKILFL